MNYRRDEQIVHDLVYGPIVSVLYFIARVARFFKVTK